MRAAQFSHFGGPDVVRIVDLPDPHPGSRQVRVAVHAAGVSPTDCKVRRGEMGGDLPQTTGRDLAGVVDEVGDDVVGVAVGDRVFGLADEADAIAEYSLVTHFAPIPSTLDFVSAAAVPVAAETATRGLDALGVREGCTVLISGASGGIGTVAVQLAVARGARVIGTASSANHEYLHGLGAEATTYGDGLVGRVRTLAPSGVDLALDVAGGDALAHLVEIVGGASRVVTLADFAGAREHGVKFSTGADGRAYHALSDVAVLSESGRFALPVARTFPLDAIAEAHRVCETGHVRGRLVLVIR